MLIIVIPVNSGKVIYTTFRLSFFPLFRTLTEFYILNFLFSIVFSGFSRFVPGRQILF